MHTKDERPTPEEVAAFARRMIIAMSLGSIIGLAGVGALVLVCHFKENRSRP